MLVDNKHQAPGKDPEDWLETCPEFSRTMAVQFRSWFLQWMPDLKESVKWGSLCFSGQKLICAIGAFKRHVGISFFRGTELDDSASLFDGGEANTNMRTIRLTSLAGFNSAALQQMLYAAVALDEAPKIRPAPKVRREPLPVPEALANALRKDPRALKSFDAMSPSCQREWISWVTRAQRPETLAKRLEMTVASVKRGHRWAQRNQNGS